MQTLRPYVPEQQDENSGPGISLYRGELKTLGSSAETPGMDAKRGLGGKTFGGNANGSAPRRALGNITNMTPAKTHGPGSTAKPTPRRALGDITNSKANGTGSSKGLGGAGGPAAAAKKPLQSSNAAAKADLQIGHGLKIPLRLRWAEAEIDALAEQYAKEDLLEAAFAGPTWDDQESDRRRREAEQEQEEQLLGPLSAMEAAQHAADLKALAAEETSRKRERSQDAITETFELADIPEIPLAPASCLHDVAGDLQKADLDALLDALAIVDTSHLQALTEDNDAVIIMDEDTRA